MFSKRPVRIAIPYALSGLALCVLSACATTPAPTATVTPLPTATPGVVIQTLVPQTLDYTATPVPPTDVVLATPAPTVTISGTMVSQGVSSAKAFEDAAPASVGPFQLVKTRSFAYQYGTGLYYRTEDGAQYTVILWLTNSAQDALDRYVIMAGIANAQPLNLGDEAVYSMVNIPLIAIIHYRNVVLEIYRLDSTATVPTVKITDDQLKQLATAMFQLIPKQ